MNMPFPSREQVETIRKNYPPGTRVMLNNMNDPCLIREISQLCIAKLLLKLVRISIASGIIVHETK